MLPYAGEAHAMILDALDVQITDEQWEAIQADVEPIDARPTVQEVAGVDLDALS